MQVITVVPCRTKSARLPNKALSPIYGVPSIERCLFNTLAIARSSLSVLATSTNPEDAVLEEHARAVQAAFIRGSETDVLARFLLAADAYDADVVIRATGDCPVVSYEIAEVLLESHVRSGADVTYPVGFAVGTNCEVYSAGALRALRALQPETPYSEYLILYFKNNPTKFRLNPCSLPSFFDRPWRLTLDEKSDLDLFEVIFSTLGVGRRAIAFQEIVAFFAARPEAAAINGGNTLRYVHDTEFVVRLNAATTID